MKIFLKPTKTTWVIFVTVVILMIINLFSLNIFDTGLEVFANYQFYLPFIFFESIGLDVVDPSSAGEWYIPNMFGYILIIVSNLIAIYLVSLLISKLLKRNKTSL